MFWFGNSVDPFNKTKFNKSKFRVCDTLTISSKEYPLVKSDTPIKTTLGRLIFNKILVEGLGFEKIVSYQNQIFTAKEYGKFDATIATALKEDQISVESMYKYIDTRDWFGLQFHAVITSSFTPGVLKVPPSVSKLKKDLFNENRKAIEDGDERVMNDIESKLIAKMKEELKGDVGMDLYNSGARGSVDNHLKNIMLTRGAIKNPNTKKYEIIENSLMDGLAKKDIAIHSNVIVSGAYPKAKKSLMAL